MYQSRNVTPERAEQLVGIAFAERRFMLGREMHTLLGSMTNEMQISSCRRNQSLTTSLRFLPRSLR